ncbi:hypothetical protein AAF712_008025 [Marasmius tenuissimus]|uniref:Gag protein n=1 Tax=Marasmius tenuissimus TaxID=585030 RepID=A0ABR2ZVE0_9AGAR
MPGLMVPSPCYIATPPDDAQKDFFTTLLKDLKKLDAHLDRLEQSSSKDKDNSAAGGSPKIRDIKSFDGKSQNITRFCQESHNAIYLLWKTLPTDRDKSLYFTTNFDGTSPHEWLKAVQLTNPNLLDDFEAFVQAFIDHFGDSDIVGTALQKIGKLQQTAEIKDALTYVKKADRPKTYKEFTNLITEIDDRIHEWKIERKAEARRTKSKSSNGNGNGNGNSHHYSPPPPSTAATSTSLPPGEPMEIDATCVQHPKRLSATERQRHKDEGLCTYCGGKDHQVKNCPNMSEAAKKAYKDRMAKRATAAGKA